MYVMTGQVIGPSGAKTQQKKILNLSSGEKDSHTKVSHMRHMTKKDRLNQ